MALKPSDVGQLASEMLGLGGEHWGEEEQTCFPSPHLLISPPSFPLPMFLCDSN